jgi:hypothetical protein
MKTYNQVKNHSESYARMMRDNFPSSFENEELNQLLTEIVFDDEKSLFTEKVNMEQFKSYIYSCVNVENKEESCTISVKELLDSV